MSNEIVIQGVPLWYFETNCYVVADTGTGKAVVIDAPGEADKIAGILDKLGCEPVAILHTHGHIDHIGGAGPLSRAKGGIPAYIHEFDRYRIEHPERQLGGLAAVLRHLDLEPPEELRSLQDGDIVDLGGFPLEVVFTPGHTEGHVCFRLRGLQATVHAPLLGIGEPQPVDDILFSGDHLFAGSVGRTDLPGGDWAQLLESLRSKILGLPDETLVLPGHGPYTTIGRERLVNPFVHEAAAAL